MTRSALLSALVLGALLVLACGGDDPGGGDLTGKVSVPEGYVEYKGLGASFLHPRGWKASQVPLRDDGKLVTLEPAGGRTATSGVIAFSLVPGGGDRFESLLEQRRAVIGSVGDGKIDSDETVELEGAERVQRVVSRKASSRESRIKVSAQSIDVLREGGDVLFLTAEAPKAADQELDPGVVISSFRLTGG